MSIFEPTQEEVEMPLSQLLEDLIFEYRQVFPLATVGSWWKDFAVWSETQEPKLKTFLLDSSNIPTPGTTSFKQYVKDRTKGPLYMTFFPSEEALQSCINNFRVFSEAKSSERAIPQDLDEDSAWFTTTKRRRITGATSTSSMTVPGTPVAADAPSSTGSLLDVGGPSTYTPDLTSIKEDSTHYSSISTRNKLGSSRFKWVHRRSTSEFLRMQIFSRQAIACAEPKNWWKSCLKDVKLPLNVDQPKTPIDHAVRHLLMEVNKELERQKELPKELNQLEHSEDRTLFPTSS